MGAILGGSVGNIAIPEDSAPVRGPQAGENTYRWATITALSPLTIRLDGEDIALPMVPESLLDSARLAVSGRVWVQLFGRRVLILGGSQGGAAIPPPTATGAAGGGLSGTYPNPTVVRAAGNFSVGGDLSTTGNVTVGGSLIATAGGGLSGAYPNPTVVRAAGNFSVGGDLSTTGDVSVGGSLVGTGIPWAMNVGRIDITPPTAPGGVSTTVTFPSGRFTQPPVVVLGIVSNGYMAASAGGSTTSGFQARGYSLAGTPIAAYVTWCAIQMSSGNAEG
jgi:hypothetical protein